MPAQPFIRTRRALAAPAAGVLVALAAAGSAPAAGPVADAAGPVPPKVSQLIRLYSDHTARALPRPHARPVGMLTEHRPLTGQRTVVPLLRTQKRHGRATWYLVRLPGRPNGHTGWIAAKDARTASTPWRLVVDIALRRVLVYNAGRRVRVFQAIVGKPATPTPHGVFFVEETVRLTGTAPGAPWALATSARSNALRHYEGGPGQIAIHGRGNLTGVPGTAASHGCVRLGSGPIRWLAARISAGVPVVLRSR